jgi:tetratricopeptide (TPR) repeat protein
MLLATSADPAIRFQAASAKAQVYIAQNDVASAIEAFLSASDDFGAAGDRPNQIMARLQTVPLYAGAGQSHNAAQVVEECVAAARAVGDPGLLADVLYQRGTFQYASGQPDAAKQTAEEGLQVADRSPNVIAQIQFRVAVASAPTGYDPTRSAALLSQAEALVAQLPDPQVAGANSLAVAQGWKAGGRADDSLRCAQAALGQFGAVSAWPLYINAGLFIADLYGAQSRQYAQEYIDLAGRIGGPGGQAEALVQLGQAAFQRGDRASTRAIWQEATAVLHNAGLPVPQQLSNALTSLGP